MTQILTARTYLSSPNLNPSFSKSEVNTALQLLRSCDVRHVSAQPFLTVKNSKTESNIISSVHVSQHVNRYIDMSGFKANGRYFSEDGTKTLHAYCILYLVCNLQNSPLSLWNCVRFQNVYYAIIEKEMEVIHIYRKDLLLLWPYKECNSSKKVLL
jgi:hypothetical protein